MRCLYCRTELDSVHWAFDGVCNACRVRYDRETLFVTQPREEPEENQAMDNPELL